MLFTVYGSVIIHINCFYYIFFIVLLQLYYFIGEVPTSQVAGVVAQRINHCIIDTYDLTYQRR